MTTWAQLLADIRADMQDTNETNPRFSNAMLYLYAKDAILDYSQWFPRRIDKVELALEGESYVLPADFLEEIFVECPAGTFLEKRQERPGVRHSKSSRPFHYFIESGKLYLNAPGTPVYLTYYAYHPIPASESDDAFALTLPDADLELLRLYVKGKAFGQTRGRQSNLDRFKRKGQRDDNPLEPEVQDLMGEYMLKIVERIPGGTVLLFRAGRSR